MRVGGWVDEVVVCGNMKVVMEGAPSGPVMVRIDPFVIVVVKVKSL
jgi:hypothetical protein